MDSNLIELEQAIASQSEELARLRELWNDPPTVAQHLTELLRKQAQGGNGHQGVRLVLRG